MALKFKSAPDATFTSFPANSESGRNPPAATWSVALSVKSPRKRNCITWPAGVVSTDVCTGTPFNVVAASPSTSMTPMSVSKKTFAPLAGVITVASINRPQAQIRQVTRRIIRVSPKNGD
jgi:hypothetical protein